jgi:hypothetical protein
LVALLRQQGMLDPDQQLSQDEYEGDSWLTDDDDDDDDSSSDSTGDSSDGDPHEE